MTNKLSHTDDSGAAHMVDVGNKAVSSRTAIAEACVLMKQETAELIKQDGMKKGDVLAVARVAGIMAAKKTAEIIPLCHPLPITAITIDFEWESPSTLRIKGMVRVDGKTGVEMEALTAVSATALTVYDMAKAVDKEMVISDVKLIAKDGGKSGSYRRSAGT